MAISTKLLTIEEYAAMPGRYDDLGQSLDDELIEGEVIVSPRASRAHLVLNHRIAQALRPLETLGYTVIVEGALPVKNAGKESVVGPDLMVITTEQVYRDLGETVYGAFQPLLAVEVLSPANRYPKLIKKAHIILDSGCTEVWIFNPEKRHVDVLTSAGMKTESEQLRLPVPGFELFVSIPPIFDFGREVQPAHGPRDVDTRS